MNARSAQLKLVEASVKMMDPFRPLPASAGLRKVRLPRGVRARGMSMDDRQLLAALTGSHREAALAECIGRYGPMVQRTAWRITGDEHLAEDVCQAVFLVLMRKSARLQEVNMLGAWLYRVAVLTARKIVEGKGRRQRLAQA